MLDLSEFGPCSCPIRNHRTGDIMPHWRSLVESKYLSHFDLQGRDCTVTIAAIKKDDVVGAGGVKSKKAVVRFEGKEKSAVMGVACLSAIASMYGDDISQWPGKRITIYPATTEASGKAVGTIRVRPSMPAPQNGARRSPPAAAAAASAPAGDVPTDEDRGDEPKPEEMGS